MERLELQYYYDFPYENFPDFDPEIRLYLDDSTIMIGYLEDCNWLHPSKNELHRLECIGFAEYIDMEGEVREIMWLIHREKIVRVEWVNDPPELK